MRVHHLNCGTMCPVGAKLVNGTGGLLERGRMICHCLLIESDDGLILVDTGLGLDDVAQGPKRLGHGLVLAMGAVLDPEETAARQVERLGFKRSDVRHIVPTHLDLDHAGGMPDFPDATVHIFDLEQQAALQRGTWRERERYKQAHWAHGPKWNVLPLAGDTWKGLDCVRAIGGVGTDVLLVPLVGHTRGHCGVAVKTGERWLLHGGDAFFASSEMHEPPTCPPALDFFQRAAAIDGAKRLDSQARLRALSREASDVDVFCAHCPLAYDRMAARSIRPRALENGQAARAAVALTSRGAG
jgi:glyoxylase-like metal-dependent hydrolase (beta-lactamase superfamily II)